MKYEKYNKHMRYDKPKIEAYRVDDVTLLFKHSKECQCKICIEKWVDKE